MNVEITIDAFVALAQKGVSKVTKTKGEGYEKETVVCCDVMITIITNFQGSQPITQYYVQDINA